MTAADILEKLDTAEVHLDCAIHSLLEMKSHVEECPFSLQKAADLLSSVQISMGASTPRIHIEPLLQSIALKGVTARRLLDGAATLYFGSVLHQGSLEEGYSAGGVAEKFGGGGLRVEG